MKMVPSSKRALLAMGAVLVMVVLAACGNGSATSTPTPSPRASPSPEVTGESSEVPDQGNWDIQFVDQGTKPALALDSQGVPTIAYMLERQDGWVKAATLADGAWRNELVAEGYFYGPLDIAIGPTDTAYLAYHDHQAANFRSELGDAVIAVKDAGAWDLRTLTASGHGGWDVRLAIDSEGLPHLSAVNPVEFGGSGAEYYRPEDGTWVNQSIGGSPITYQWATSVALDAAGRPHVTYHDGNLKLAVLDGGEWTITEVDSGMGTGRFAFMVIDANDGVHISYVSSAEDDGRATGEVRYAYRPSPDAEWQLETIDTLTELSFGFLGARNSTSLALDESGAPWVAYGDEQVVRVAHRDAGSWSLETVATAEADPFGQQVSLKVDAQGRRHLAYSVITSGGGALDGDIIYAVTD